MSKWSLEEGIKLVKQLEDMNEEDEPSVPVPPDYEAIIEACDNAKKGFIRMPVHEARYLVNQSLKLEAVNAVEPTPDLETLKKSGTTFLGWDLFGFQICYWGEYEDFMAPDDEKEKIVGWTDGAQSVVWDGDDPDRWWTLPDPDSPAQQEDYSDEVTSEQISAIENSVKDEGFEEIHDEWERILSAKPKPMTDPLNQEEIDHLLGYGEDSSSASPCPVCNLHPKHTPEGCDLEDCPRAQQDKGGVYSEPVRDYQEMAEFLRSKSNRYNLEDPDTFYYQFVLPLKRFKEFHATAAAKAAREESPSGVCEP